jgi:hypothetical protein
MVASSKKFIILLFLSAKGENVMNEDAAKALCKLLEDIAATAITTSQKVAALEILLRKDKKFDEAYRIELARTQSASTVSDTLTAIGKFQSKVSWR